MNLNQFKDWAVSQGSVSTPAGTFKGECVSLIQQYLDKVFGIPFKARGNAKDWSSNSDVLSHFDKVSDVQAGDILVYGSNFGGGYGHIEIALGNGQALQQNRAYDGKIKVSPILNGYSTILRRKGMSNPVEEAKTLTNLMRVLNSEAKGWDRDPIHKGSADVKEREYMASLITKHGGNAVNAVAEYSQAAWDEGAQYRKNKDTWKKAFDEKAGLEKKVKTLEAEIKTEKSSNKSLTDGVGRLQTELDKQKSIIEDLDTQVNNLKTENKELENKLRLAENKPTVPDERGFWELIAAAFGRLR